MIKATVAGAALCVTINKLNVLTPFLQILNHSGDFLTIQEDNRELMKDKRKHLVQWINCHNNLTHTPNITGPYSRIAFDTLNAI